MITKGTGEMGKRLVLLEFADEAKSFINYCKDQAVSPDDYFIVALQPEVQVYLKNTGIYYENTLNYFPNRSHASAMLKSEEWLNLIAAKLEIGDETGIKETYKNSLLYYIRFYLHYFLNMIEVMSIIFEENKIESVHAFLYKNEVRPNMLPVIQNYERYAGIIAKKYCDIQNKPFICFPCDFKPAETQIEERPGIFERILSKILRVIVVSLIRKRKVILLTSVGYNMGSLMTKVRQSLNDQGGNWIFLGGTSIKQMLKKWADEKIFGRRSNYFLMHNLLIPDLAELNTDSKFKDLLKQKVQRLKNELSDVFIYRGINFSALLIEKIEKDLIFHIFQLHNKAKYLNKSLNYFDAKLLVSPFARDDSLLLAEMLKNRGIPTFMVSHGTLGKPQDLLTKIEYLHLGESLILCDYYSHVAIQTPSDIDFLRYYNRDNKRDIKTGPLIFARVDREHKEEFKKDILGFDTKDKIILYPETLRARLCQRFHSYETFDEFLSSLTDLVRTIDKINGVRLVIRMHPGKKFKKEDLELLLPKSDKLTILSSNIPLYKMLTITDLLINYTSTVIDEAIQNNIPVLLYDKHNRYMHYESQKLGPEEGNKLNAIYYLNDPDYLKNGLQWLLDNHMGKETPKSIYDRYVFREELSKSLFDFIAEKTK